MLRITGTVTYQSGAVQEFDGGPAAMSRWERFALAHGYPTLTEDPSKGAGFTMSLYLAWASIHARKEGPGFDAWADTVADLQLDVQADVPPTPPEPLVEPSPSWPS